MRRKKKNVSVFKRIWKNLKEGLSRRNPIKRFCQYRKIRDRFKGINKFAMREFSFDIEEPIVIPLFELLALPQKHKKKSEKLFRINIPKSELKRGIIYFQLDKKGK